jgi:Uma2 family endonuclease
VRAARYPRPVAAPLTGLLSGADLAFEPDDGLRRELHDGVVHVVPPPSDRHSRAVLAAYRCLFPRVPPEVEILHDVGVHVGLRRLYVPDLLAVHRGTPYHDNGFDPGGVLLVVEAVSPSSVTMDRVTKPAIYAEQGIPYFWRLDAVDRDAPRLEAYALDADADAGRYVLDVEFGPGKTGTLRQPWSIFVDMAQFGSPGS